MGTLSMKYTALTVLMTLTLSACAVSPVPLDEAELNAYASAKHERVSADQEPITGAVTLYEAMARAIKYNLDKQVEVMNVALADQQLRVACSEPFGALSYFESPQVSYPVVFVS
jgi:starvation-inducible outer membrane lipoprotein